MSAPDGILLDDGRPVCDLKPIARLPGRHNWQNACAAYAMARADGLEPAVIAGALASYPGLAHRQELVAEIGGVAYVNDSKATNADAAEKALVCYDRIRWIIGGQAKEGGIAALEPHFPRVARAYLMGEAAAAFATTLAGKTDFVHCGTLAAAVAQASHDARPGEVVLLSPACASWDQFTSFEHRGEVFRDLVAGLASGTPAAERGADAPRPAPEGQTPGARSATGALSAREAPAERKPSERSERPAPEGEEQ